MYIKFNFSILHITFVRSHNMICTMVTLFIFLLIETPIMTAVPDTQQQQQQQLKVDITYRMKHNFSE